MSMNKRIKKDFKQSDQVCVEHKGFCISSGELDKRLKTIIKIGGESIKISDIVAIHAKGTAGYNAALAKYQARKDKEAEYERTRLTNNRSNDIVRMIDRKNSSGGASKARLILRDMDEHRGVYMFPPGYEMPPVQKSTVTIPLSKLNDLIGDAEDLEHAREAIKKLAKIISDLSVDMVIPKTDEKLTDKEFDELIRKEL